jgi:hypothetical protein
MANMLFTNNAATTLASSINNIVTSLTVATGGGALFPNPSAGQYFYCTLANTAGTVEIIKVTARSGDTFSTIVRAQDGTLATSWNSGDKVELRLVNANLTDFPQLDSDNTFAGTQTLSGLTASKTVFTDASKNLSSTGTVAVNQGGTGQTSYTDGQLLIGNTTGNTLAKGTLTAGTGISVTNGPGASITIASTSTSNYVMTTFSTPGTWTKPATIKAIKLTVVGGGGGSGGANNPPIGANTNTGSGGGGGTAVLYLPASSIPGPQPVTVGTGGSAGGTTTGGGAGNSSSFGPLASATGGGAGTGSPAPASAPITYGAGGAGSGGDLNITGGIGFINSDSPGPVTTNDFVVGGPSFLAAGGTNAGQLGSGGGRPIIVASGSTPGYVGGNGVVIVEEFY